MSWLWLGAAPSVILAQEIPVFVDEFDDNRHQWPEVDTRTRRTWFEEGHYLIQIRSNALNFAFFQAVNLEPDADFDLEVALLQETGDKNMGLGLVWGAEPDERDLFTFLISTNGQYTILRKLRHAYSHIKRWTESPLVGKPKTWNIIRVSRRGDRLHFYLNGQKVYAYAAEAWRGDYIGLLLHGDMRVRVDYLRLTLPPAYDIPLEDPVFPLDSLMLPFDSLEVLPYTPSELLPPLEEDDGRN